MGATVSAPESSGAKYEVMEGGTVAGRCIQVIELGTFPNNHPQADPGSVKEEVMLVFETNQLMEDGRPFVVNWRGTKSLGDKANLRKLLVSWRGVDFTEEQLKRFELKNVLDAPCMINVSKNLKRGTTDKYYNGVLGVSPLMKGLTLPERVNELVDFGIADGLNSPTFKKLYPWVQKIIQSSNEFKGDAPAQPSQPSGTSTTGASQDDDIPF